MALAALLLVAGSARATRHLMLDDEFDDWALVGTHDRPEDDCRPGSSQRVRAEPPEAQGAGLHCRVRAAAEKPAKTYAMPVAQARGLMLSGLRYGDPAMNKDHTDFYVIPGVAGVEVYYQIDGESPAAVLVYLPVDQDFRRLTADNLAKRLAWDAERLERLKARTAARSEAAFPWEMDRDELARLTAGDFETNAGRKLAAWIASGQALGYTYQHKEGSNHWRWFTPDGGWPARRPRPPGAGGDPVEFIWYRSNRNPVREEWFDHPTGELPASPMDRAGREHPFREFGLLVLVWEDRQAGPARVGRQRGRHPGLVPWRPRTGWSTAQTDGRWRSRHLLTVDESWAAHLELIPADYRCPTNRASGCRSAADRLWPGGRQTDRQRRLRPTPFHPGPRRSNSVRNRRTDAPRRARPRGQSLAQRRVR